MTKMLTLTCALFLVVFSAISQENILQIDRIWRSPVELTFAGCIEAGDEFTFKVHSSIPDTKQGLMAVQFLKIGDTIFGYEIDSFTSRIISSEEEGGLASDRDESFLLLKDPKGNAVRLPLNTAARVADDAFVANLKDSDENLWRGKSFWIGNRKFYVKDIAADAVMLESEGDVITLNTGVPTEGGDTGSVLYFEFKEKKPSDGKKSSDGI
jgi:hypothetical protein